MWFKNIQFFQFQSPMAYNPDKLDSELANSAFRPCPKSHPSSYGWVQPIGDSDQPLVYGQNGYMMIRLRIEEKVLPASVVREHLMAEIKQLESKSGRRIYKDEKERLKDDIYQTLLSKAFTKSSYVNGYIDTKKNWLIIDSASSKRLAHFISMLMKCTGNSISAPELTSIPRVMTQWLTNNDYPNTLNLADACLLKEVDENGGTVRFKKQDLLSDKVQAFIKDGSIATQLAFEWCDQIHFTLKQDFSISSVKFLEAIKELARDGMSETAEERFASDFIIMAKTVSQFMDDLLPFFLEHSEDSAEAKEKIVTMA